MDKPEDLVPESKGWACGDERVDLSLERWVAALGSFELAIGYSAVFWPRFHVVRGSVVRLGVTEGGFDHWSAHFQGDRVGVEKMVNHLHVADIQHPDAEGATPERMEYLGNILKASTAAKLALDFPERRFQVDLHIGQPDDPVSYEVTLWEDRDGEPPG